MPGRRTIRASRPGLQFNWPCALLALMVLVLGGGGSRFGILNLVVEIGCLGFLLVSVSSFRDRILALPTPLLVLCALSVALPLLQIIPLPPGLWRALPGGDLAYQSRSLAGTQNGWFPLSVFPMRTAAAAAALIVPIAAIILYDVRRVGVQFGLLLVAALGVINLVAGAFQILAGRQWIMPYQIRDPGRLYGLFANHNSCGLMFVIAGCALLGIEVDRRREMWKVWMIAFAGAAFAIGSVLTQSRSSTALMILPVIMLVLRIVQLLKGRGGRISPKVFLATLVATSLAGAAVLTLNENARQTVTRFEDLDDSRPDIWADAVYSIDRFFPFGAGMGNFNEVFQVDESLETLLPTFAGRAHNDYIEIGVEAGIFGWLLVAAWGIWLALMAVQGWRRSPGVQVLAAPLGLAVIALQSLIDYPLRNLGLFGLAGLLVAVLAAQITDSRDRDIV